MEKFSPEQIEQTNQKVDDAIQHVEGPAMEDMMKLSMEQLREELDGLDPAVLTRLSQEAREKGTADASLEELEDSTEFVKVVELLATLKATENWDTVLDTWAKKHVGIVAHQGRFYSSGIEEVSTPIELLRRIIESRSQGRFPKEYRDQIDAGAAARMDKIPQETKDHLKNLKVD